MKLHLDDVLGLLVLLALTCAFATIDIPAAERDAASAMRSLR